MRLAAFALLAVLLVPAASAQKSCLSGDCEDGQGRARYDFTSGAYEIFEGRFLRGEPTGEGTLEMSTGWTYEGQFSGRMLDGIYLAMHTNGQQERVRFDDGSFVEVVERIVQAGGEESSDTNRGIQIGSSLSSRLSGTERRVALTLLGDTRPADAYTLLVGPGLTATVRMESDDFDTYLLVERNGEFVARNDDFDGSRAVSQVDVTAPDDATGNTTYTVYAGPFSESGTGDYTLEVSGTEALPVLADPAPGPPLSLNGTATSGTIAPSDARVELTASGDLRPADAYSLRLGAGQRATVRMESKTFDTYLKVVRDGAFVVRNDDFGGSRSVSQVEISAPSAGTFTVYAGTFTEAGRGAYTIRATSPATDTGRDAVVRPAASGPDETVVQSAITDDDRSVPLPISDAPRRADAYTVEARAGQRIIVEMTADAFDTYLRVERGGVKVAHNDDAGSTSRSYVEYTVEQSGTHVIYAGTFHEAGRGAYTVRYRVE